MSSAAATAGPVRRRRWRGRSRIFPALRRRFRRRPAACGCGLPRRHPVRLQASAAGRYRAAVPRRRPPRIVSDPFGDDARAGGDADTVPPQQAAVEAAGDIAELLDQGGCQRDRAHGFQAEDEDRLPGRGDLGDRPKALLLAAASRRATITGSVFRRWTRLSASALSSLSVSRMCVTTCGSVGRVRRRQPAALRGPERSFGQPATVAAATASAQRVR